MEDFKHTQKFWDTLASGNYRSGLVGWYEEHNEDPNEALLLFRGVEPDGTKLALDFGCGPGRNMIKFKDWFKRIDGADISSVVLEKAKIDLAEANVDVPNLYHINGRSLDGIADSQYDVVFSIICMQHIGSRNWRLNLYKEFNRVLVSGGLLTFQMGYGPGHGQSVDYFHDYSDEDEARGSHFDTRVEDVKDLQKDLEDNGFVNFNAVLTDPCHDQHPQWIWVQVNKE